MGREVRMVPADWMHPKEQTFDHRTGQYVEKYKPLFAPGWAKSAKEWDEEREKWERGEYPSYTAEANKGIPYDQYAGRRPYSGDYMPDWPAEHRTHYMMYEDTSEGTPTSPAFATPEELAQWLADNGASAFDDNTTNYEHWLRVASGGLAPSMVITNGVIENGVQAL